MVDSYRMSIVATGRHGLLVFIAYGRQFILHRARFVWHNKRSVLSRCWSLHFGLLNNISQEQEESVFGTQKGV
jgi:hypothetical protein